MDDAEVKIDQVVEVSVEVVKPEAVTTERSRRERKQTTVFNASASAPEAAFVVEKGHGITLGEYDFFVEALEKHRGDDEVVKGLHSLLFGNPGKKLETKKHLRSFNGFADTGIKSEKLARIVENKKKWTVSLLKDTVGLFGLEKGGTRNEIAERLVDYLAAPTQPKSIRSSSTPSKKRKASGKSRSSKKQRKGPKGTPSAYILFCQHHRPAVKESNPEATFVEMGKLLAVEWGKCSAEDKQVLF